MPVSILYPIALTYVARKLELKKDEYGKKTKDEYVEKRRMSKDEYVERRVLSISGLLLVLVCRSVAQEPPQAN